MSDHDSDYVSDYSTDSDPPRQHPLFAAMDTLTASVAAAHVDATPPQPAAVATTACDALPQPDSEAGGAVQPEDKEPKGWSLLTLRDFTLYMITAIKNGEMEEEAQKTSMSEKYKA